MARDRHLNLFHNYNNEHIRGSKKKDEKDSAGRGIIEDNLTRAFILFLDFLNKVGKLNSYLEYLPKHKMGKTAYSKLLKIKNPEFDLQNLEDKQKHKWVQGEAVSKILWVISTIPFDWQSKESDHKNTEQSSENGPGNRADAWIIGGDTAILLEAKIGDNPVSKKQLIRHLTDKEHGFGLTGSLDTFFDDNAINLTWRDITQSLAQFSETADESVKYFAKNLMEYILMANADVKITNLLKSETDAGEQKQIFAHILSKVNKKIELEFASLKEDRSKFITLSKRPLDGLWDYWGFTDEKGEAQRSPHISLGYWPGYLSVSVDTYDFQKKSIQKLRDSINGGQIKELLKSLMTKENEDLLHRYKFSLKEERLWDWKKGQISGEMYDRFRLELDFEYLNQLGSVEKAAEFLEKRLMPFIEETGVKRFRIDYQLRIPFDKDAKTKSKEGNKTKHDNEVIELFNNEEKMIELFAGKILEFYKIILDLKV